MGAEQSAPRPGGQASAAVLERKTCYYEVLGVDRQAADTEIRKAYKKKALELHPDRNFNDEENATRKFAEVQTAYEILSDPQERAWYDSHREAILTGQTDASGAEPSGHDGTNYSSATAIFTLMSRFNSSVRMDDSPSGFFGILNSFFDQLAAEETAAAEWEGIAPVEYPAFGRAGDVYDSVAKPFYKIWSGFSTKKTFSWKDKYRLSDAPDRRVRRLMEKENRKFREEGIREFNDAVLSLVSFVRKRDPRYIPNTQSESERQQILRNSAAAQAARSRAANQEKLAEYVVPEWAQVRDDEEQPLSEFSLTSEEESEIEVLECVVCNKTFKSERQFEAHEKSKKHVKAVQQLRRQMRKENADFDLDVESPAISTPSPQPQISLETDVDDGDDTARPPLGFLSGKARNHEDNHQSVETREERGQSAADGSSTEDDEYAPRSAVENRFVAGNASRDPQFDTPATNEGVDSLIDDISGLDVGGTELDSAGKKLGKAKLKREKRAARQAAEASEQSSVSCNSCTLGRNGANIVLPTSYYIH
ncbi:hypothetical protein QBC32DRAFT_20036 [Pseudoneurospora amorphoporcata]|uniref:Uncharacterized protein n=1 Tax=Pseudoneurospora amorphoporcata TaxID=241081 RepID=A0AAN6NSB6_9PEZI|nr:hypothetical protein QBC32DRAFT_20036 [Pseudoneurospora amorphoporcata]